MTEDMYLVDTNVWLVHLLDQTRSDEVARLNRKKGLLRFVQDASIEGDVALIHLPAEDAPRVLRAMEDLALDFDDAYQYVASEKSGLTVVSFDADFDRTRRGRKTPAELLS